MEKRGFSAAVDCSKDFAALQLGNTRYFTDIDTAQQLCSILDDLQQEEYDIGQKELAKMLGTDQFIYPPEKDWSQPICRLPGWLWEALWTYAQRHDINCSNGEWTLFDGHTSPGTIRLLRRPGETISNGIVMELQAKGAENNKTVYWHRGMIWSLADWEGFTDDEKWRADQSLDWLLDHWLPRLSEELYSSWRPWGVLTWLGHKIGRIPHKKEFIANIRSQVESFKK